MSFFLLLLFTTASYIRPWDMNPEWAALRIPFWLGVCGIVAGLSAALLEQRSSILRSPQLHALLAFTAVVVLSPVLARGWLGGAANAYEQFSTALIGYILIILTVNSPERMRTLAITIVALSLVVVLQGFLAVRFDHWREWFVLSQGISGPDGEYDRIDRIRALGYLNDPNDLAQALVAAMPLLWPFWRRGRGLRNWMAVVLPTLALLYGVFLTRSRGGAISVVVIALLACREKMRFRRIGPIAVALMLVMVFAVSGLSGGRSISSDDESGAGRLEAWRAGFAMLRSSPIYGVGYGAFTDFNDLTAHNSFVLCFAELGIAGYFFWIGMLIVTLVELRAVERNSAGDEGLAGLERWAFSLRFCLYGFLAGAFFLSRTYSPTLYMSLAMGFAVIDIGRRAGVYEGIRLSRALRHTGAGVFASIAALYVVTRAGSLWMR